MLMGRSQQGVHDHENGCEHDEGRHAECLDNHVDNLRMNDGRNYVNGIANVIASRHVKCVAYGENWEWENARGSEMGTARGFHRRSWGCIRSHFAAREQWLGGSCCS